MKRIISICLAALLLTGCFVSKTSLYQGVAPLRPFRDGAVFTATQDGKGDRTIAHEIAPGVYRFESGDSKGQERYRFFPLPGTAPNILVEEVQDVKMPCRQHGGETCQVFLYGLWKLTPGGVVITNPDCDKVKGVAKLPGVTAGHDKSVCGFSRRATLEQALRLAAAANLSPDYAATLRQ